MVLGLLITGYCRPLDVVGVCLIFYLGYVFLQSFLFRQLPSEFTERNSTKLCYMFGNEADVKMHVQKLGYHVLSLKIVPQKLPIFDVFWRPRNLTPNIFKE